jgi:hypothetical protein
MQDSLITLLTQAMTQPNTAQTGNGAMASEEDQGLFGQILSSIIGGAPQEFVATDSAPRISVSELFGRDPLVPELVEKNIGGLLHQMTMGSHPAAKPGCLNGLTTEDTAAEHGPSGENSEIGSLLLGVLSRATSRIRGGSPQRAFVDKSSFPAPEESDASASVPDEEPCGEFVDGQVRDEKIVAKDASVIESLALLLFSALQKMTHDHQASPLEGISRNSAFTFGDLRLAPAVSNPSQVASVVIPGNQGACRAGQTSDGDEQTDTTGRQYPEMEKTSVHESTTVNANLLSNDLIVRSTELSVQMGLVGTETPSAESVGQWEKQPVAAGCPSRENDSSLAEIRRDLIPSVPLSTDKAERFLEDAIMKLKTMTEGTPLNEVAEYSKSGIEPVRVGSEESTAVSFVLKGVQKPVSQGQSAGIGPLAADDFLTLDDRKTPDVARSLESMLSKIVPIITGEREGSPSQTDSRERRQRPESHVFPGVDQTSSNRATGEEKSVTIGHQTAAVTVERFEKIAEQIAGKSSSHNLTMKLDIEGDENVVVGLKDFGQTVAVEVRASHQGLINLFQSQKDAIIRHLEGKEVRTNIVIDPNASGTPERRDRREGKRRIFTSAPQGDEVFGTFFYTFA